MSGEALNSLKSIKANRIKTESLNLQNRIKIV
jgi:hypothetical protein